MLEIHSLCGGWTARSNHETNSSIPAEVPGCIHLDLLRAGRIPDPFWRDNELKVSWVGESEWTYQCEFKVEPGFLEKNHQVLHCEGLDTLAEVLLNGESLGKADNMFRMWEFDVKGKLEKETNRLEVRFSSPVSYGEKRQNEYFLWMTGLGHHKINGGNWLRKEQCNFGWDWGPMLPTCGIWRPLSLRAWDRGRLGSTYIRQYHPDFENKEKNPGEFNFCDLEFQTAVETEEEKLKVSITLYEEEEQVAQTSGKAARQTNAEGSGNENEGIFTSALRIENPKLWWPNGMGSQPLYRVVIKLLSEENEVLDRSEIRIGLRKLELIREEDAWGQSFTFAVNGRRFFAKGANWIPAHVFDGAVDRLKLDDLLQSARDVNMNMIRVWGGGIYESEDFYDLCDEKGLLVWQDFMFACSAYPAHDPEFMENVRMEAREQVTRLQYRTCLALWCGNNELEQINGIIGDNREAGEMTWEDYRALFDTLLGGTVSELDPGRPYIPSSEYSPVGDRKDSKNPRCGDAHLWAVWHGREPFEWYRTSYHRFCSEFGFQSFPHPATVEEYTLPEERNITSYVMEHHQRSRIGNSAIIDYMLEWFRLPIGWRNTVRLSQILQAYAIKYAVEHWRRNMPRCMGALYWQLNDCWPVASWASLDSNHRWKALHYEARRFFEPVHLSLLEEADKGVIEIHLSNDLLKSVSGNWTLTATNLQGDSLVQWNGNGELGEGTSASMGIVDLGDFLNKNNPREVLFWGEWTQGGEVISRNLTMLARPKHMALPDPRLRCEHHGRRLTIHAVAPALFVCLESRDPNCRFSDNFFHLPAGERKQIEIVRGDDDADILVSSLFDTYQEAIPVE